MPQAKSPAAEPEKGLLQRLVDLAISALPAIGGAVGFIGFVAVLGGAIQWVRFNAVQLPASQAVNVTPQGELVAIGAQYLIEFTLLGMLAVVALYIVDPRAMGNTATARALLALAAVECIFVMVLVPVPGVAVAVSVVLVVAVALLAIRIAPATTELIRRWSRSTELRRLRADWEEAAQAVRLDRAYLAYAVSAAVPEKELDAAAVRLATRERALADAEMRWAEMVDALERSFVEEESASGEEDS